MDLYNTDVHRMIDDIYAPEFAVVCPGLLEITDRKHFHEAEAVVLKACPDRRFRIENSLVIGDQVVVECVLSGTDQASGQKWESPWCAILTIRNGKVALDRSYVDHTRWPGFSALMDDKPSTTRP